MLEWLNPVRWLALGVKSHDVLSINGRNLEYIYPNNSRADFPLADDKLRTKTLLTEHGIPVPETFRVYSYFYELANLEAELSKHAEFVIKPSNGRAGGGIVVISQRVDDGWLGVSGKHYTLAEFKRHISDIIFGIYSLDMKSQAIIEKRLIQHPGMSSLSSIGLSDLRVILYNNRPVMAMLRLPTTISEGKANLHQGAVGVGVDLDSGETVNAIWQGKFIGLHPDFQHSLVGKTIPFWLESLEICRRVAEVMPLKYVGVDLSLTMEGPVVLEVNARPGLEIQNANNQGMRAVLKGLTALG